MRKIILISSFWWCCFALYAQSDTLHLSVVQIVADSSSVDSGGSKKIVGKIDTEDYLSLVDAIWKNSSLYLRTYGVGSLATLSLRGGSSNQSTVFWNGVPVNNPMLGISDISLVSMSLVDQVNIVKGGFTSVKGSGSMTGYLDLSQRFSNNPKLQFATQLASFGNFYQAINAKWKTGKIRWSTKLFNHTGDNDFEYILRGTDTKRRLTNAEISSRGWSQGLEYQISEWTKVNAFFLLQNTKRNIPPVATQEVNVANQEDHLVRLSSSLEHILPKGKVDILFAYIQEDNNYKDSISLIDTQNEFVKWYGKGSYVKHIRSKLTIGLHYDVSNVRANTEFYEARTNQWIHGLTGKIDYTILDHLLSIAVRKEWNNLATLPLSPSLNWRYNALEGLNFMAKASYEFRAPTLNELLWRPGGNPDLLPEEGWSQELGMEWTNDALGRLELVGFHRLVDNWILWTSGDDFFVTATNINKVRSYGLDASYAKFIKLGSSLELQTTANYSFNISRNVFNVSQPRIEAGSQLFYTPLHSVHIHQGTKYKHFLFSLNYNYTSEVVGLNENVDAYSVFGASVSKDIQIKKSQIKFGVQINNLLNADYRVVERRPMPGRNYNLTIKYTIL